MREPSAPRGSARLPARPGRTDPGEVPAEDRHRPGDPDPCPLESLAQPAQSRHAAARRPWPVHTQDERCSGVAARAIDLATGERTEGPLFRSGDGRRLDRHATYIVAAYVAGAAR
jgi:hypothetical protein